MASLHPHSSSTTTSCRRRNGSARSTRVPARSRLLFSAVVVLASLASSVSAARVAYPPQITVPASLDLPRAPLSLDTSIPSPSSRSGGAIPAVEYDLLRRDKAEDEESSSEAPSKSSARSTGSDEGDRKTASDDDKKRTSTDTESKTTLTPPASRTPSATTSSTPTAGSSALPVPFDDALPSDFKTQDGDNSCPDFIANLLSDATFKKCYPISMLMQSSRSFFNAQKQLLDIVRVLDASCNADLEFCTNYLNDAARKLKDRENCGEEFNNPNASSNGPVKQAYNGLRAYNTMYRATCLQDPQVDMYCFATAVTNLTMPSDTYLYYMPYGLRLPGSSTPSCNQCVAETMGIFHSATADRSQLIAETYEDAARQINTLCGPSFVDATLPPPESSFGFKLSSPSLMTLAGVFAGTVISILI